MKLSIRLLGVGVIFLGMNSCMQFQQKKNKTEENNLALSLMENFLNDGALFKEIKKILGEPDESYKRKNMSEKIYVYNNKNNNLKEWKFGVDDGGKVTWLNHEPWSNPLLDRVEILPQTWKKYHCKKRSEPDTRVSHVIEKFTFFECAGGKIRAYYNVHGEIGTIYVEAPRRAKSLP